MAIAIKGARIFRAADDDVLTNGVVVVGDDGRIASVGQAANVEVPRATETVNFPDSTILPGLIDMHAHTMKRGITELELRGEGASAVTDLTLRGLENLRNCVRNGVTTVRDVGAPNVGIFRLRHAVDSGSLVGPRIIASGQSISITGGHGWATTSVEADGAADVRKVARTQIKHGADWLKVMATGGAGSEREGIDSVQMSAEEMRSAVEEAHTRNRRVAAHATGTAGVLNALDAGVDSIEHGVILDEPVIVEMVRRGAYYVPTLEIYAFVARGPQTGYPAYAVARAEAIIDVHRRSFQRAVKAGVKVVAGTDAGGGTWPLGDLSLELRRMVEYGMSPAGALRSATSVAAACLAMEDDLGTLQPGRWGDVLVVAGNPLDDIETLGQVLAVFKAGARVA